MNNTDVLKSTNEQSSAIPTQDLPGSQNCQTPRNCNANSDNFPASPAGSFATNGDMWRPW